MIQYDSLLNSLCDSPPYLRDGIVRVLLRPGSDGSFDRGLRPRRREGEPAPGRRRRGGLRRRQRRLFGERPREMLRHATAGEDLLGSN